MHKFVKFVLFTSTTVLGSRRLSWWGVQYAQEKREIRRNFYAKNLKKRDPH